jgi:hypothetical protein
MLIDIITRTSHYKSFSMSGTGYNEWITWGPEVLYTMHGGALEGAQGGSGEPPDPPPPMSSFSLAPTAPPLSKAVELGPPTAHLGFGRIICRFRNRGAEYVSGSGMKWMSGGTKRQCDRALRPPHGVRLLERARWGGGLAMGWQLSVRQRGVDR